MISVEGNLRWSPGCSTFYPIWTPATSRMMVCNSTRVASARSRRSGRVFRASIQASFRARCTRRRTGRHAGHERCRLSGHAQLQQNFAIERDLADEMAAIVGQEHRVVGRHMNAVRSRVLALAPGAQEISLAVEDHHRMLAAIEDMDIVFTVDTDSADFLERPALGKFRPIGNNPVSVLSVSDDHRNIPSRDCFGLPPV